MQLQQLLAEYLRSTGGSALGGAEKLIRNLMFRVEAGQVPDARQVDLPLDDVQRIILNNRVISYCDLLIKDELSAATVDPKYVLSCHEVDLLIERQANGCRGFLRTDGSVETFVVTCRGGRHVRQLRWAANNSWWHSGCLHGIIRGAVGRDFRVRLFCNC